MDRIAEYEIVLSSSIYEDDVLYQYDWYYINENTLQLWKYIVDCSLQIDEKIYVTTHSSIEEALNYLKTII